MSREEILRKHEDISKGHLNGWQKEWVLKAMQEYSDQQNTLLQEQFEDLKRQNLELQEKLDEKEKEISEVNKLNEYILEIDWLTTTEFCNKFNVPHPRFTGEVESSVNEMLRIDAVKHRMFVEKAKEIRKNLTNTPK